MSERIERLRAELALAELEEDFIAAKENGTVTRQMKEGVRAARHSFRSKFREQVNVTPGTAVSAAASKKSKGGTS